jgi:cytochrome P450
MSTSTASEQSPRVEYDPLVPRVTRNPYPYYRDMRDHAPVAWIPSMNGFAVTRWDDVMTVLRDGKMFSSSKFWPELLGEYDPVPESPPMISLDPPDHLRTRKLASQVFVPSRVAALEGQVRGFVTELVDGIIAKHGNEGEFDYVPNFSAILPATVIAHILGVDPERRHDFKHWSDQLLSAANRASYTAERLSGIEHSSKEVRQYFETLYDRRNAEPGDDLYSGFIHAEVGGKRLTRSEVLNMAILLMLGGSETTANLLAICFLILKASPESYREIREDKTKIPAFVEEALRYDSPVQILFRHTSADTSLHGIKIPQGSLVMPILGAANRDERRFEDPDKFLIARRNREIISFGQGPHYCLGQYLSRLEVKVALEILLDRFERLLPAREDVSWMDTFFARGVTTLPMSFKVR